MSDPTASHQMGCAAIWVAFGMACLMICLGVGSCIAERPIWICP